MAIGTAVNKLLAHLRSNRSQFGIESRRNDAGYTTHGSAEEFLVEVFVRIRSGLYVEMTQRTRAPRHSMSLRCHWVPEIAQHRRC